MLKGSQTTPAQVPPPRDGASIVKEIWEFVGPIYPDQGAADPGTKWKLRLYSFDDFVGHPPTLGPVSGWSSNTSLNLDLPAHPTAQTVSTQDCPLTPGQALAQPANSRPAVFPGCFLNRFFPVCLVAGDTLLSNPSSEAFPTEPCIAILVGFHVMEWQDGAWNWGTFWWTADHGKGLTSLQDFKADDGRPTQLPIRYQFFSMMEEDGASTIEGSLEDSYTHFYNPYFEGSFDENGTQTNCQSCHARSSYVPKADIAPFASSGSFSSNHNGERDCSTAQTAAPAANRCVLHTGWSWSIADAADAKFNFLLKVRHEAAAKVQQFQDQ